ncbi:hypothetical protein EV359DRAFT_66357 [Lentinula novae-zelandiae]|nr:hypothetical protein EV359DRAFT_66357 [Lentinula novae-zelandiae]
MVKIPLLALILLNCRSAAYPPAEQYAEALDTFVQLFHSPQAIIDGSQPSKLAENVIGRVDFTNTFVGQELNIEYIYGFFVTNSDATNQTHLIGQPMNSTVQSLIIEPPVVYVSIIQDLFYQTIHDTLPLQVDLTVEFDEEFNIKFYDSTWRRLGEAMAFLLPKLLPQIARELALHLQDLDVRESKGTSWRALSSTESTPSSFSVLLGALSQLDSAMFHLPVKVIKRYYSYIWPHKSVKFQVKDAMEQIWNTVLPLGDWWAGGQNIWFHTGQPFIAHTLGPPGVTCVLSKAFRDYVQTAMIDPFNGSLVAFAQGASV